MIINDVQVIKSPIYHKSTVHGAIKNFICQETNWAVLESQTANEALPSLDTRFHFQVTIKCEDEAKLRTLFLRREGDRYAVAGWTEKGIIALYKRTA